MRELDLSRNGLVTLKTDAFASLSQLRVSLLFNVQLVLYCLIVRTP